MIAPYQFSGPYSATMDRPEVAMDRRHIYMVYEVLNAGNFENALEIGSFCGASATAFVEAVNCGSLLMATFCDLTLQPSMDRVMNSCRGPVRFTREPGWAVLESPETFDIVLVDAGHTIEDVEPELRRLMARKPRCVVAHDTNASAAGYPSAEGAAMLADAFRRTEGYQCLEDCKSRPNERTERGLFLATTDLMLYECAQGIFAKYA